MTPISALPPNRVVIRSLGFEVIECMMKKIRKNSEEATVQVLVVGNVTVDETYAVPSTPKPGESLIGQFRSRDVGGKGANVATVLTRCGVATWLIAGIGQDDRGKFVQHALSQESMQIDLVPSLQYPTDLSLIYTDSQGENSIVTTVAATQCVDGSQARLAMESLQKPGFLVLQGNLSQATTHELIDHAKSLGIIVVLNPSPCADWLKNATNRVDIVVLNEGEAQWLTDLRDEAAVQALLAQGPGQVVLTCGGEGALLGTRGTSDTGEPDTVIESVGAVHVNVVDTTGAGDAYLGTALASAILRGTALDALALHHAAEAAAITVSRYGTRSAFPDAAMFARILADC